LVLAGCNQVLGLDPTTERPVDAPPPQLLYPPPDAGPCAAPPDLTNLTFEETITVDVQVPSITMYRLAGAERMIAARIDPSVNGSILDWDLSGTPQAIPELTPPPGVRYTTVGSSPEGAVLWIQLLGGGLSFAVRAAGWAQQQPDFGLPQTTTIIPGSVGYHGGTARMVVLAQAVTENMFFLVELSSPDGEHWTRLDTVKIRPPLLASPSLSADGCVLLYGDAPGIMHVAYRDADGNFTTFADIAAPPYPEARSPTMSPDLEELWFTVSRNPPMRDVLVRGHH
jgi:hypothetical protein